MQSQKCCIGNNNGCASPPVLIIMRLLPSPFLIRKLRVVLVAGCNMVEKFDRGRDELSLLHSEESRISYKKICNIVDTASPFPLKVESTEKLLPTHLKLAKLIRRFASESHIGLMNCDNCQRNSTFETMAPMLIRALNHSQRFLR